jgi:hypothetical protein
MPEMGAGDFEAKLEELDEGEKGVLLCVFSNLNRLQASVEAIDDLAGATAAEAREWARARAEAAGRGGGEAGGGEEGGGKGDGGDGEWPYVGASDAMRAALEVLQGGETVAVDPAAEDAARAAREREAAAQREKERSGAGGGEGGGEGSGSGGGAAGGGWPFGEDLEARMQRWGAPCLKPAQRLVCSASVARRPRPLWCACKVGPQFQARPSWVNGSGNAAARPNPQRHAAPRGHQRGRGGLGLAAVAALPGAQRVRGVEGGAGDWAAGVAMMGPRWGFGGVRFGRLGGCGWGWVAELVVSGPGWGGGVLQKGRCLPANSRRSGPRPLPGPRLRARGRRRPQPDCAPANPTTPRNPLTPNPTPPQTPPPRKPTHPRKLHTPLKNTPSFHARLVELTSMGPEEAEAIGMTEDDYDAAIE